MKNSVKAMNQDGAAFQYILQHVSCIKPSKAQERYLRWIPNQGAIKDEDFGHTLSGTENAVWNSFRDVAHNFLGNAKAPNCIELVEHMIDSYKNMGCPQHVLENTLLTLALKFFPSNCGDVSD